MRSFFLTVLTLFDLFLNDHVSSAQLPAVSPCAGQSIENCASKCISPRNIDIGLPNRYVENKRHSIGFLKEGQMLTTCAGISNHHDLGFYEAVGQLIADGKFSESTIAGIGYNCDFRRSKDPPHAPNTSLRIGLWDCLLDTDMKPRPRSERNLKLLSKEPRPNFDKYFACNREKQNTFLCVSNTGDLISVQAVRTHPEVFGGSAPLSDNNIKLGRSNGKRRPETFIDHLTDLLSDARSHESYFDYATKRLDTFYGHFQARVDIFFIRKRV